MSCIKHIFSIHYCRYIYICPAYLFELRCRLGIIYTYTIYIYTYIYTYIYIYIYIHIYIYIIDEPSVHTCLQAPGPASAAVCSPAAADAAIPFRAPCPTPEPWLAPNQHAICLGVTFPFFPGILLLRKPSKTQGKRPVFEKNDGWKEWGINP